MPVNDIKTVTQMVRRICDDIDSLTDGLSGLGDADVRTTIEEVRVGELENLQMLTLELTRQIMNNSTSSDVEADSVDGGVFATGELNYTKGEYEHEDA